MSEGVKNLLLLLCSLAFSILAIEAVFRALDHNFPLIARYDIHTGFTNASDISGWSTTEAVEHVTLDSHGLRVGENRALTEVTPQAKPPDVFRIAVLGDSYTEGFYVRFEDSFPRVLERELATCPDARRRIEVLNFGVSGYSNVQELLTFRHKARHFQPDLVLLVIHPDNDLRNNFRKQEQNPFIPYAEFRNGRLVLDETFRAGPDFQSKLRWSNVRNDLANKLWSAQFVVRTLGRWRTERWNEERTRQMPIAPSPQPALGAAPPAPRLAEAPAEVNLDSIFPVDAPTPPLYQFPEHLPPDRASDEILWRLVEAIVAQLRDEVTAANARLWITSTATGVAITPSAEARAKFVAERGLPNTDYARWRLAHFAAAAGIAYVPLVEALRDHAVATGLDLEWFAQRRVHGHWIPAGHAVVGQTLAQAMCAARAVY